MSQRLPGWHSLLTADQMNETTQKVKTHNRHDLHCEGITVATKRDERLCKSGAQQGRLTVNRLVINHSLFVTQTKYRQQVIEF